jgi:hypothetical protein
MTRKPHPRQFTFEDDFVSARMDFAAAQLERVTPYDGYMTAERKRALIAEARDDARNNAREDWEYFLEHMTEAYERGVGAGWA